MACALRANIEQIESVSGLGRRSVGLTGGLSRSGTFAQMLCNVLDTPVVPTNTPEASALGAAICASVGAGLFPSLEQAAEALVSGGDAHAPNADEAEAHAALYERWCDLRAARAQGDARARMLTMPFALGAGQVAEGGGGAGAERPSMLVAADFDAAAVRGLRELGEVEYASFRDAKRMLKEDSLVEALAGVQVFVTEIDLVDAGSLERLPDLRVVGTCRSGAVNVDIEACTAFGIPVLNTPGRNADSVADLTLGFMLMLARRFPGAGSFLAQPGIEPGDMGAMGRAFMSLQGQELWRKTIGLVGLGAVGRKVAERLAGFSARVIAADPMISRGAAALVDEDALLAALQSGDIAGAALDTFSVEPPGSDHPFVALDNVISTPHIAGNTTDVAAHQGEIMLGELRRLLAGERPRHVLNPETLAAFSWNGERPKPDAALLERLKQGSGPVVTDLQKKA
jgi:autoinducer 2 (AI-2) kinase